MSIFGKAVRSPKKTFFAAIIGLGCNIGIKKIGKISRHINQSALERAVTWYLSEQTLESANDAILSFTKTLYLPTLFQNNGPDKNQAAIAP